jgi:hypothetical protein
VSGRRWVLASVTTGKAIETPVLKFPFVTSKPQLKEGFPLEPVFRRARPLPHRPLTWKRDPLWKKLAMGASPSVTITPKNLIRYGPKTP